MHCPEMFFLNSFNDVLFPTNKGRLFHNLIVEGTNELQSTLVISTSVISNNRLSRRENLVRVLTQKSKIRLQNIVEKRRNCSSGAISPLFYNIFNIYF